MVFLIQVFNTANRGRENLMTLSKKKSEAETRDRHFIWTKFFCYMYFVWAALHVLFGLAGLTVILPHPVSQEVLLDSQSPLGADLLNRYVPLIKEYLPFADASEFNGKLFSSAFLFLCLIAYDLPILFIAWKGCRILHIMEHHPWSPFIPEIAEQIRWIGKVSLFIGLFGKFIIQVGMGAIIYHIFFFQNPMKMSWILTGLILLLVSDIFNKGCALQKEADETL